MISQVELSTRSHQPLPQSNPLIDPDMTQKGDNSGWEVVPLISSKASDGTAAIATATASQDDKATTSSSVTPLELSVAEAIETDLVSQICIEIAWDAHRMAKTGVVPLSTIMEPSGPLGLDDKINDAYSTKAGKRRSSSLVPSEADDLPSRIRNNADNAKRSRLDSVSSSGAKSDVHIAGIVESSSLSTDNGNGEVATTTQAESEQPTAKGWVDIWGNLPPKEPKTLAKCEVCGKLVSALRFASHLDKCMNLGNTRHGRSSTK